MGVCVGGKALPKTLRQNEMRTSATPVSSGKIWGSTNILHRCCRQRSAPGTCYSLVFRAYAGHITPTALSPCFLLILRIFKKQHRYLFFLSCVCVFSLKSSFTQSLFNTLQIYTLVCVKTGNPSPAWNAPSFTKTPLLPVCSHHGSSTVSTPAAATQDPRLGDSNGRPSFLAVLEAGSPRPKRWQIPWNVGENEILEQIELQIDFQSALC